MKMKIKFKLMLIISGVVALAVFPISSIVLYRNEIIITQKTFEVCRNLSHNIAKASTEELLMGVSYDATRSVISGLNDTKVEGLLDAFVVDHDYKVVSSLKPQTLEQNSLPKKEIHYLETLKKLTMDETGTESEILRFAYPIFIDYKNERLRLGTAVFQFDKNDVYRPIQETRSTIFYVSAVIFILAIIISIIASIIITKPILSLSKGAKIIGGGNLTHRIKINSTDEIGTLATSFNEMAAEINDFTDNLEAKVDQRTKELNETLGKVNALKEQQDGDYFLTSLLTKPLQINNVSENSPVLTKFIVEQKKKFNFRKRESEIGGDICTTDTIVIGKRKYTVVINGDAMGKSIQGAGGALVLGAAFKAHIIQSRIGKTKANNPEIWLRNIYLDLQNIFVSFDGSMYISILLGLIDHETGFFYFINAEHPSTILFRDGKAEFIDDSMALRKLGTPEEEAKLAVRTFQFLPQDILITGSDGRDDIIMKNAEGEEYINEDENQILHLTEKAKGDISVLAEIIHETGELKDDLSLLSIEFTGEQPFSIDSMPEELEIDIHKAEKLLEIGKPKEALRALAPFLNREAEFPELLEILSRIYLQMEEYDSAIMCLEHLLVLRPQEQQVLYHLSYIKGLQQEYDMAADYGECLFLRNRYHKQNTLHLAQIYYEMEVKHRALFLLDLLFEGNPDHPGARKLFLKVQNLDDEINSEKADTGKLWKEADEAYKKKSYFKSSLLFQKILEKSPTNTKAWSQLGTCQLHNENYKKAAAAFIKVILFDPEDFRARNNLAVAYFHLNKYESAKDQLEKVMTINPHYEAAEKNLELIKKKYEETVEHA